MVLSCYIAKLPIVDAKLSRASRACQEITTALMREIFQHPDSRFADFNVTNTGTCFKYKHSSNVAPPLRRPRTREGGEGIGMSSERKSPSYMRASHLRLSGGKPAKPDPNSIDDCSHSSRMTQDPVGPTPTVRKTPSYRYETDKRISLPN